MTCLRINLRTMSVNQAPSFQQHADIIHVEGSRKYSQKIAVNKNPRKLFEVEYKYRTAVTKTSCD